ncbi:hypothetical protein K9M59_04380 [Candidatus Gracilibacteria bacterium]|nr:hypothetical protein [Candidatus Gracilibacteria bacterium]MCF7819556.1 hypothetical protein [Candidatus Gracilibacteria bacterium]
MKKFTFVFVFLFSFFLLGCGEKAMTDADMAEKYGLSIEEFQEQKQAAARMNMSIEDHLRHSMDHSQMNH